MTRPSALCASAFHRHPRLFEAALAVILALGLGVGLAEVAAARTADTKRPVGGINRLFAGPDRKVTITGWAYQPGAGSTAKVHIVENRWHYQVGRDRKHSIHTVTSLYRPDVSRARHTAHTHTGFRIVVGQPHGLGYGTDRICIDADVHVNGRIIVTHLGCRVFTFHRPLTKNHKILAYARTFVSRKYHYSTNAAGPRAFDCSGFTKYVYRRVTGKNLLHSAQAQYAHSHHIARPTPGDLVFYLNSAHHAFHVGIYAGRQNYKHRGVIRPVMVAAIDTAEDMGYQAMIHRSGARFIVFGTYTH